jgi:hypothetical protein
MPQFEVNTSDRERAQRLMQFVRMEFQEFSVEARFVFAVEMSRMLQPEIQELKRRAEAERKAVSP